jgi:hypothetical protein
MLPPPTSEAVIAWQKDGIHHEEDDEHDDHHEEPEHPSNAPSDPDPPTMKDADGIDWSASDHTKEAQPRPHPICAHVLWEQGTGVIGDGS